MCVSSCSYCLNVNSFNTSCSQKIWLSIPHSRLRHFAICIPPINVLSCVLLHTTFFLELNQHYERVWGQDWYSLSMATIHLCCILTAFKPQHWYFGAPYSWNVITDSAAVWQKDGWEISCTASTSFIKIVSQPAVFYCTSGAANCHSYIRKAAWWCMTLWILEPSTT